MPPYSWLTEAGLAAFFAVAAILLILRRDLDPVRTYLSEYATGPGGWAMQLGFALLGLASMNLVPGFMRDDLAPDGGRPIGWLLASWAGAVLIAGFAPVDPQGQPVTATGAIHLMASLVAFGSLFGAMAVAARRFARSTLWRPLARGTRWVAVAAPVAFALEATLFSTLGWVGTGQWLLYGLSAGWLYAVARNMGKRSSRWPPRKGMSRTDDTERGVWNPSEFRNSASRAEGHFRVAGA